VEKINIKLQIMKKYVFFALAALLMLYFNACSDNEKVAGNPVIITKTEFGAVLFGDSVPFTVHVSDNQVPLSTLKARLFFSDDLVSEVVIRTRIDGDYTDKIHIPYFAHVPNGTATLKLVLQNIHLTITEQEFPLPVSRPDFPYLTLVTATEEYRMQRTGLYEYAVEEDFPARVRGYIKAPAVGNNGNEMTFGWGDDSEIEFGSEEFIPFSNSIASKYAITFNTLNYEASPFITSYSINDEVMIRVDDNNYRVDIDLAQGEEITVGGIEDFDDWWIDPDFFAGSGEQLTFVPISGRYRIIANFALQYLRVEAMSGNSLATLQPDGSGAIWIIGNNIGKPSLANTTGWSPDNAICMAPIGNNRYRVTLVAGTNVTANTIDFKFFHQKGWGAEFTHNELSTTSDIVFVGDRTNGRDAGNLGIVAGESLTPGATYLFTIDVLNGIDNAVLTVEEK
jgi:hypothetical protein